MKRKKLTDRGIEYMEKIEGADEIEEIEFDTEKSLENIKGEIPRYERQVPILEPIYTKPTRQETRQLIREANNEPEAIRHKVKAIKKSTYVMIWVTIGILLMLLIWTNTIFSLKDFATIINITNDHTINVDNPTTNNLNNTFTIINENNLNIPDDVIENITEEIADKIISELNNTIRNITNWTG